MGWEVFANLSLASWGPRPGIPPDDCKSFPKRLWTEEQGCHLMDGLNRMAHQLRFYLSLTTAPRGRFQ